jgi:hypothetical protein
MLSQYADNRVSLGVRVGLDPAWGMVLDAGGESGAHHQIGVEAFRLPVKILLLRLEHSTSGRSSPNVAAKTWR